LTPQLHDIPGSAGPDFFQSNSQRRSELGSDIAAAGLIPRGPGTAGGYQLDQYLFETKPTVLRRLASLLCERVPAGIDRLAGSGTGAVVVATALSLESGIPFVVVHERPQQAGADAAGPCVTGECHRGERVLLVEAVVEAGVETVAAAGEIRAGGLCVDSVLAVVDRELGAADAFRAAGLSLDALFSGAHLVQEAS
jgi:orotate phosphoribosyltransferase